MTRSFKETVQARVQRDAAFREALLREGVDAMLSGDLGTGKEILRDYINATVGFEALSAAAHFTRIRRAKLGRFTIDRLMTI